MLVEKRDDLRPRGVCGVPGPLLGEAAVDEFGEDSLSLTDLRLREDCGVRSAGVISVDNRLA